MTKYLIRRSASSVVVIIGITFAAFALLYLISPSPAKIILGDKASLQAIAQWNKANGYDRPFFIQFLSYLNKLLHGNLGESYKLNQSVDQLFAEKAPVSAYLSGVSLVLSVGIAIPLGIYQAVKRNSVFDVAATSTAFILYSTPAFLLGTVLIELFALKLHVFGFEASQHVGLLAVIADWRHMFLPIATLTLVVVAGYSRYMRSSALDSLAQDYIRLARAKGLSEAQVLRRHLLRNSSLAMITLVGLSIPNLLAGNLVVESVFNYQGLGLLFYNALGNEDYQVLIAYTVVGGILTVLGNLMADIALTVADPRIRIA
jgi:peptide/nickel transport system permease protein